MPDWTPSQTVGPFFAIGLPWADGPHVVAEGTPGAIRLRGVVYDGAGDPVPDALVETWQADGEGRLGVDGFRGFGRCPTDERGEWSIVTVKPGRVDGEQAPHVDLSVFARGLLDRVVTRLYFGDDADANAADPVLRALPDDAARAGLVAAPTEDGYRLDIHLQGPDETAFFVL